jgi:MYXO-CTERM domain-containing protein
MSLWKVSDASTAALMTSYYRRLLAGEGRSEAMRNTQLEMLRDPETRHPRDWAAFVVVGEWGPLSSTTREGPEPIPPRPRGCQASVDPNSDGLGPLALALVALGAIRRRWRKAGPERAHT